MTSNFDEEKLWRQSFKHVASESPLRITERFTNQKRCSNSQLSVTTSPPVVDPRHLALRQGLPELRHPTSD